MVHHLKISSLHDLQVPIDSDQKPQLQRVCIKEKRPRLLNAEVGLRQKPESDGQLL